MLNGKKIVLGVTGGMSRLQSGNIMQQTGAKGSGCSCDYDSFRYTVYYRIDAANVDPKHRIYRYI